MRAARLDDVITYLEMRRRPSSPRAPAPLERLALMRAEACTVSYYRYLYAAVGERWLWFERRLLDDDALLAEITKSTIEIFVLYVRGVPAGFFELDTSAQRETKLCYFGLMPEFIGHRLGLYFLQAAIDEAWSRPIARMWLHTSSFDHPRALGIYQRAGFVVYDRQRVTFEDPRTSGILPKTITNPRLPPLP